MEPEELLHLIDRLEDERSRARRREGIWISVIAHIILFWFLLYGPKYLPHRPRVVTPAEQQKDMTYLNLPPDALKNIKPKPQAPLSDKNRIAQSRHPAPDRKTLQQLQSMLRSGQPRLAAPPVKQQPAPQQAPPQQAQARPQPVQPAPPPPMRPTQQAQVQAPTPAPTRPNFNTGPQSPSDAIQQAIQNAARHPEQSSGDYGANAPSQHPAMQAGVDILSDTLGVNFGPYLQRVIADTYRSWLPIIPESARPPLSKQGKVGIRFRINPDGSVSKMILEFPSGDVALDRAAWGGITNANYPPLPKAFKGPFLELRFGFYYNLDPNSPQ